MIFRSPAKLLAELSVRARLHAAQSDHDRMMIRTAALRKELGLPPIVREMGR